jgi:hypothetical protein
VFFEEKFFIGQEHPKYRKNSGVAQICSKIKKVKAQRILKLLKKN